MFFNEETENEIDGLAEEFLEAVRDERLVFFEGCTIVTAPTGAPPEYITVMVDGVNDPNVHWRGVPPTVSVGDKVLVSHNPISDRREIIGGSGATEASVPLGAAHQIFKVNAAGTGAGFESFDWDEMAAPAGADMVHDHSAAAEGGDDLNPETISTRMLVVGTGCPYTTLGAAVAAVPGTPCTVKVLGITTTEAGDITVPANVTVAGQGRGSVIGMGANVLSMSNGSSLKDLTISTTMDATTKYCVNCDGVTGYELFNVVVKYTPHTSGANVGFYFHGASNGAAYHCVAEPLAGSATGTVDGFAAEDSAVVLLWDCEANDTTNLDRGLYIGDTADVTTKHCTFRADGDDVLQAAAGTTWSHIATEADPANVTLPGTIALLPRIRDEIGCGLWRDAVQAIPTGAWTAISFNVVSWDDASDMGCATAFYNGATPTRATVPAGLVGRYTITGGLAFVGSAAGNIRLIGLYLNGATFLQIQEAPFSAAWPSYMSVTTPYPLAAGDFIELMCYQDTGGNLNVNSAAAYTPVLRLERK